MLYVPYYLSKIYNDLISKMHMALKISLKGLWTCRGPGCVDCSVLESHHQFCFKGCQGHTETCLHVTLSLSIIYSITITLTERKISLTIQLELPQKKSVSLDISNSLVLERPLVKMKIENGLIEYWEWEALINQNQRRKGQDRDSWRWRCDPLNSSTGLCSGPAQKLNINGTLTHGRFEIYRKGRGKQQNSQHLPISLWKDGGRFIIKDTNLI